MIFTFEFFGAVFLDFLFGDPAGFPHPVRLIGKLCIAFERLYRGRLKDMRIAGVFTVISVLLCTLFPLVILLAGLRMLTPWFADVTAIFLLYTSIACRDLQKHSLRVYRALTVSGDLHKARMEVGRIVGRDTAHLDRAGVSRACVETVAENMVDGVTAPVFFAILLSLLPGGDVFTPISLAVFGAFAYKTINTMDSMFGYKNEAYIDFGRAAAKVDDVVNFLPARLSGILIIPAAFLLRLNYRGARQIFLRDRLQHASPNAGHPEAAVAGALGIQLGGSSWYFGEAVEKPTMGDVSREITASDILVTNRLMLTGSGLFVIIMLFFRYILLGG